jgi:hypothetical protein
VDYITQLWLGMKISTKIGCGANKNNFCMKWNAATYVVNSCKYSKRELSYLQEPCHIKGNREVNFLTLLLIAKLIYAQTFLIAHHNINLLSYFIHYFYNIQ